MPRNGFFFLFMAPATTRPARRGTGPRREAETAGGRGGAAGRGRGPRVTAPRKQTARRAAAPPTSGPRAEVPDSGLRRLPAAAGGGAGPTLRRANPRELGTAWGPRSLRVLDAFPAALPVPRDPWVPPSPRQRGRQGPLGLGPAATLPSEPPWPQGGPGCAPVQPRGSGVELASARPAGLRRAACCPALGAHIPGPDSAQVPTQALPALPPRPEHPSGAGGHR